MRIIVEYKDGTYASSYCISLKNIEERTMKNREIDEMLCDEDFKQMFIIPDDAYLGGFTTRRHLTPNVFGLNNRGERYVYSN